MRKRIPSYDWVCFSCGKENSAGVARCSSCDCSAYLQGEQIVTIDDSKLSQSEKASSKRWGWIILFYLLGAPVLLVLKSAAHSSFWIWLLFLGSGVLLAWFIGQLEEGRRDE